MLLKHGNFSTCQYVKVKYLTKDNNSSTVTTVARTGSFCLLEARTHPHQDDRIMSSAVVV